MAKKRTDGLMKVMYAFDMLGFFEVPKQLNVTHEELTDICYRELNKMSKEEIIKRLILIGSDIDYEQMPKAIGEIFIDTELVPLKSKG